MDGCGTSRLPAGDERNQIVLAPAAIIYPPSGNGREVEGGEVLETPLIASTHDMIGNVVSPGTNATLNARYRHVGTRKPQVQEVDSVADPNEIPDSLSVPPSSQGSLEGKTLPTGLKIIESLKEDRPCLPLDVFRSEAGQSSCNHIRIHKMLYVEFVAQKPRRGSGFSGTIRARQNDRLRRFHKYKVPVFRRMGKTWTCWIMTHAGVSKSHRDEACPTDPQGNEHSGKVDTPVHRNVPGPPPPGTNPRHRPFFQ